MSTYDAEHTADLPNAIIYWSPKCHTVRQKQKASRVYAFLHGLACPEMKNRTPPLNLLVAKAREHAEALAEQLESGLYVSRTSVDCIDLNAPPGNIVLELVSPILDRLDRPAITAILSISDGAVFTIHQTTS